VHCKKKIMELFGGAAEKEAGKNISKYPKNAL
jgi:hypothetical protein